MARAHHAFLDLVGGIFGDQKPGLGGGEEGHGAGMAELEGGGRIARHEGLFDRDGRGRKAQDHVFQFAMQRHQPEPKTFRGAGGDHAMFDMGKPGAVQHDHAPAHAAQAGVKAKNANRPVHALF